jgi:hypothetical protein
MSNESVVTEIVGNPAADAQAEAQATPQESSPVEAQETSSVTESNPETTQGSQSDESDDMSARFAALSRKEKYLQEQAAAHKAEVEAYKASIEGHKSQEELVAQFKQDPKTLLDHYGISFDDLTMSILGEDAPPPTAESQIEALRAEIEGFKTEAQKKEQAKKEAEEEAYQKSIDEAILAHQHKITDHLSQNAEKYELIKLQGEEDLVWEVTEAHYEAHDGEILTPEQAADKVEAYLEKKVRDAMNLARFGAKTQEKESAPFTVEEARTTEKPKSHTLTSDHAQQAAPSGKVRHVDLEESKRRAANLLKWN